MKFEGHAIGYAWAFAAATANASQDNLRKLASGRARPVEIVALSEIVNVVVLGALVLARGKGEKLIEAYGQTELVLLALAAGVLKFACAAALQHALRLTPLSLCVPYFAFTPLFLLVMSFFLVHETPTAQGVAVVCVITAGAYMLNANGATGEEGKLEKSPRLEEGGIVAEDSVNTFGTRRRPSARGPLDQLVPAGSPWHFDDAELSKRGCLRRSLTTQMSTLRANPGSLITLGIAAMYALVADLDKLGKLHTTDLLVFMFMQRAFLLALPLAYVLIRRRGAFVALAASKKVAVAIALIGLLDIASMFAFLEALNYIFTSYAVAAKRTSILASVLGSAVFFKEPIARRLPYVMIMFAGMALILLADAKH